MFGLISRHSGKLIGSAGAGTLFLAYDAYKYKQLQEDMTALQTMINDTSDIVDADQKNWLILGRQSPGYVRDTEKTPKEHLQHKIHSSSIWFKSLGTQLDNEKHFDLFAGSDFVVEMFAKKGQTPKVRVQPEKMLSDDLDTINDDELFEVGFARKQGFADITQKSPFFHSSIALRKINKEDVAHSEFVVIRGQEIKEVIARTNKAICDEQSCNLFRSNCYSASIYAGGELIKVIAERGSKTEDTKESMQAIIGLISVRAFDNFARGVSNNSVVLEQLTTAVPQVLEQYGLGKTNIPANAEGPKL
ncbi:hypothetical protein DGG96_11810 [Legionella qingyii]|uniref:Uncharacterized protein n=1 Tax=Legionella qingyii TaxID=2184757 RepID=A0A317U2H1_9GAMM|nr:hypothetical protein [Legionella qingyii]PWY55458.1 hypothetical protein DGG96_11810 [Legionella qingyii]RUR21338.1 hypothetical protein ELY20_12625 [Legionella qingyii]RUR24562.1 hypothetical protein ELY16_11460 [Legionella qingyii]